MISFIMAIFYLLIVYNVISYIFFWVDYTNSKKDPNYYDVTDELMFLGKSQVFAKSDSKHPRKQINLSELQSDTTNQRVLYL
jgi:hypothetical protein